VDQPAAAGLNFGVAADFSIEGWIKPIYALTTYGVQMIVDKRVTTQSDSGAIGYAFYVVNTSSGAQLGCQITGGAATGSSLSLVWAGECYPG